MTATILCERRGTTATVTLSHPGKLNALTASMWVDLARVFRELSAEDGLRCVVLRGAGREAFAAGADIAEFARVRATRAQGEVYHRELVHGALAAVGDCRHPVVAMIHGPCVGGGLELASQCDLRLSGTSGRFGVPINRLGFAIAYDELMAVLPVAGPAVMREILIEGRVWDAAEAYAKGLLTRVVPDEDLETEVDATVARISSGAPLVARWHKQFIRRLSRRAHGLTQAELDANFDYFETEDFRVGYDAFMNKRKPDFRGR